MSILIQKHESKYTPGKSAVICISVQPTSVVLSDGLKEDSCG
jgi:hypothetical protein